VTYLDAFIVQCTCENVASINAFGFISQLFLSDLPFVLKILFIAGNTHTQVIRAVLFKLFKPVVKSDEAGIVRHITDQNDSVRVPEIYRSNGFESFLASCIPNLS
jgi:hypothetical protein